MSQPGAWLRGQRRAGGGERSHSSRERLKPRADWRPSLLHSFLHWFFFQQSGNRVAQQRAAEDAQRGMTRAARVDMCTWNYQRVSRHGGAALWCPQVRLRPVSLKNPSTRLLRLLRVCAAILRRVNTTLNPSQATFTRVPHLRPDYDPGPSSHPPHHSIAWTAKCALRRGWCRHQPTIPWKRRWRRFWLPLRHLVH
jgi:hypothetical protein